MSEFYNKIEDFSNNAITNIKNNCFNEEAVKMYLVLPFLQNILGYDTYNPNEVRPEFSADFKDKQKNRVDYVILSNDKPIIAIECKAINENLSKHVGQLRNYFTPSGVQVGILTNGICWQFYTDTKNINIMDDEPFFTLNFENIETNKTLKEQDLKILQNLHKQNYNINDIKNQITNKILLKKLIQEIKNCSNGSSDFVRFILSKINIGSSITQKKIDEYKEIVILAFKQFINNQTNSVNTNTENTICKISNTTIIKEDNNTNNITQKSTTTKKNYFSFYKKGIKNGDKITFISDKGITATVVNEKEVEYQGKIWKLSPLVYEIYKNKNQLNSSGAYHGGAYFEFNGIKLTDLPDIKE
ncbi:MAG: type I restriction enzyme HsdR N-terminal domain-containing protein [Rickettsiales bacterium]|nr:type I restriction enzyme HsdR N-terminal domain-containing protein [Rickettsiales bacterium]